MKTFEEWLKENEENLDRDVLNQYMKASGQWRKDRRAGVHQDDFKYTPEMLDNIRRAIEIAKKKITNVIKTNYSQEWRQYVQWEKKAKDVGFAIWNMMGIPDKLPRWIEIGSDFQFLNDRIIVPQDFANMLLWREIIKRVAVMSQNPHPNQTSFLRKGMYALSGLLKN